MPIYMELPLPNWLGLTLMTAYGNRLKLLRLNLLMRFLMAAHSIWSTLICKSTSLICCGRRTNTNRRGQFQMPWLRNWKQSLKMASIHLKSLLIFLPVYRGVEIVNWREATLSRQKLLT